MKQGQLRIIRVASNPKEGTFGAFLVDGKPICNSLEPYSRDNARSVSCIPTGQYICERVNSPKYGNVWTITNIQGRSHVLIHWGNIDDNTEGCVITGEKFGMLGNKWAVLESKNAFKEFMRETEVYDTLLLTVVESY